MDCFNGLLVYEVSDANEEKLLNELALGGSLAGSDRRETHYKTFSLIYDCLAIGYPQLTLYTADYLHLAYIDVAVRI